MEAASENTMVNSRVRRKTSRSASKILEKSGLTISSFIRNSLENIVATGEVPKCGFPARNCAISKSSLKSFLADLDSLEMPGYADFPDMNPEEVADAIRMERYGN